MISFFDAFNSLSVNGTLSNCFIGANVERITASKVKKDVFINILMVEFIPYRYVMEMEKELYQQIFKKSGFKPRLMVRHQIEEDVTLNELLMLCSPSLFDELRMRNVISYNLFCQSPWEVDGKEITITCDDGFITEKNGKALKDWIERIFPRRFNREVEVKFNYVKHKREKKNDTVKVATIEEENPTINVEATPKKHPNASDQTGKRSWTSGNYKRKKKVDDPDIFYGNSCEGDLVPINDIQDEIGEVVCDVQLINMEERFGGVDRKLFILTITDFTDSIIAKVFVKENSEEIESLRDNLKCGSFYRIKGMAIFDKYDHDISISSIRGMKKIGDFTSKRMDDADEKRVELHCHTQMSDMDSVVNAKKLLKRALMWGHKSIAITDHGVVQGFPEIFHAYQDLKDEVGDFKIIYGMEAYLVDDTIPAIIRENGQSIDTDYVVFDIETTGFNSMHSQIIEIGAVKLCDGKIVDRFSTFVNPHCTIPAHIVELTSITDDSVKDASELEDTLQRFQKFCEGCVLVAHNSKFDIGFIRHKAAKYQIDFSHTIVDTVPLARMLYPDMAKHTLKNLTKELHIVLTNHHRAVDDAEATAEIFLKFINKLKKLGINTLKEANEFAIPDEKAIMKMPSYHAIMLCKSEVGRINLYRMVSESHLTYFRRRPRIPKSLYLKSCEGLMIGSACEAGELYQAILNNHEDEDIQRLVDFYDYLEIQPLGNNQFMIESEKHDCIHSEQDLKDINKRIVELGEINHKLVVATCDVHFLDPEDSIYRAIIMSPKYKDADNQAPLYLRTTQEMINEFMYLGEEKAKEVVVTNTNKISDLIERIEPVRPDKCPPVIENSEQTLREICEKKAHEMYGEKLPPIVEERLEKELDSIIGNGFSVMYIIAQKLVWKSNEDGYLVGSRGSVGSSFAATMSGITEVNPLPAHYYCEDCHYSDFDSEDVKQFSGKSGCDMPDKDCPVCGKPMKKDGHDIPFETFLGFYGDKEPDIDLNFSGEYQSKAHEYTEVIFGKGHTFRAGTIGTLADKTAFGYVKNYYGERGVHKRNAEIDRLVSGCVGVRRTTGQHPGGIIVLPHGEDINSFTPIQHPANDMTTNIITTHFDYHKIDHNLLKLDILGHDDPTMIRMLEDLTGIDAKMVPLDDEKVLSLFDNTSALGVTPSELMGCDLGSLGIPEFGTDFVMQMLRDTKPKHFSDLVRISGLSHGTDVWLNNAQYYIETGDCTLGTAICTRDDIMTYLIYQGVEKGLSFKIMESVRKGKGLKPEMESAMIEKGVPDWYIESCKKIKYMFPKAHAVAYVMMAFRIAYCKVYYPLAYYTAFFSIRATAFNYEIMCLGQGKLEGTIKEFDSRSNELSKKEQDMYRDMKIVQEMYARGFQFEPIDIFRADAKNFQIIDGKIMPSLSSIDGMGEKAAEGVVLAAKDGEFSSREDFKNRSKVSGTVVDKMAELGLLGDIPRTDQMSLLDFM